MVKGLRWIIRMVSGFGYLLFLALSGTRFRAFALVFLTSFLLGACIFLLILAAFAREDACAECKLPTDPIQIIQK
jgi:hypothetical protein